LYRRIDDIQDNSILRRSIPPAHAIYGVVSTISAAKYVLFVVLDKVLSLNHLDATTIYKEQLLELHRGQGMEYQEMVKKSKDWNRDMRYF
jgi:geranylgeranyl diphosphate synthase type 3